MASPRVLGCPAPLFAEAAKVFRLDVETTPVLAPATVHVMLVALNHTDLLPTAERVRT